jgi:hypothetical protein
MLNTPAGMGENSAESEDAESDSGLRAAMGLSKAKGRAGCGPAWDCGCGGCGAGCCAPDAR